MGNNAAQMGTSHEEKNEEQEKLINAKVTSYENDDKRPEQSSHLAWAESSWTRWLHIWCW